MYSPEVTQASNFVQGVDSVFVLILGFSFFFLIGLTLVMIYFMYKYNRKRHPVPVQIHGSVANRYVIPSKRSTGKIESGCNGRSA